MQRRRSTVRVTTSKDTITCIELFIGSALSNKDAQGACTLSHKWSMFFHSLAEKNLIRLKITLVDADHIPRQLRTLELRGRLPVIILDLGVGNCLEEAVLAETEPDREALLRLWNCVPEWSGCEFVFDLMPCLNALMKSGKRDRLDQWLESFNDYLAKNGTRFVQGNEATYIDCCLAPKLQHLRVAGFYYHNYQIHTSLIHLRAYISNLYQLDAFKQTCPTDRDILLHYADRMHTDDVRKLNQLKQCIMRIEPGRRLLTMDTDGPSRELSDFRVVGSGEEPIKAMRGQRRMVRSASCGNSVLERSGNQLVRNFADRRSAKGSDVGTLQSMKDEKRGLRQHNLFYRKIPPASVVGFTHLGDREKF